MTKENGSQSGEQVKREQGNSQYEDWPKDDLMQAAEVAGIEGHESMSKEELVAALQDQ